MAFYLVSAAPKRDRMEELEVLLRRNAFAGLRPFGKALTRSLRDARIRDDGTAVWEEEDYCSPPLAQERAAVLDDFFENLSVEPARVGEGWDRIRDLPRLFPGIPEQDSPRTRPIQCTKRRPPAGRGESEGCGRARR